MLLFLFLSSYAFAYTDSLKLPLYVLEDGKQVAVPYQNLGGGVWLHKADAKGWQELTLSLYRENTSLTKAVKEYKFLDSIDQKIIQTHKRQADLYEQRIQGLKASLDQNWKISQMQMDMMEYEQKRYEDLLSSEVKRSKRKLWQGLTYGLIGGLIGGVVLSLVI
jgi:hypothetical protein